ncbi:uncharacterized protein LOC133530876 [Cydia pomonella]|uniref:uncharacterized protein LOC133530876 n=1 Tax=Cydia pomonella TaxID=82600 RepID=UPI002ADDB964|nr:uncharacterized protein LOC133530876 [Cydia pomonella]
MKLRLFLPLLLMAMTTTAQMSTIYVTRNILKQAGDMYSSQHDIVNLVVPPNRESFWDKYDNSIWTYMLLGLDAYFFVEADNNNGEREYHGLYLYRSQNVTKLLDNGRDATAFATGSEAYLAATDGIYVFDYKNGTIKKYGTLTDNIIQIEANYKTGVLYFVSNDHQVFTVADEGTKKNKVNINDAQEIAFDFNNNMYYYDGKKDLYVLNQDGNKKIEGIPKGGEIILVKPTWRNMGVFAVVGNDVYLLNANGSARKINVVLQIKPTAYAQQSTNYLYFALDKTIFRFQAERVHLSHIADLDEYYDVINYQDYNGLGFGNPSQEN